MGKPITIPRDSDELREMLTNRAVMKEVLADPETFVEWTEASIQARIKHDPAILNQVSEQQQDFMIKWLRESGMDDATRNRLNLDALNTRKPIKRSQSLYNKTAIGAKYDDYFADTTDFLTAIHKETYKDDKLAKKLDTLKNDLSSVKPSDGGFLIPEVLRAELLRVALERAVVRSRARVIPMDSLTVPFPAIDSTSNVSSVFGGVTGYWTEEGATLTESQPRFGRIELTAHKLTLYTEVPSELMQDSKLPLRQFIDEIFPEALAWFEDIAFFIGGGVGEPLGFLNAPATVYADRAGSSTDTVVWADIVNMYARMLPSSLDRAVWIISPSVLPQLLTMTVGSGNAAVWLGGGNFPDGSSRPPMSLLGAPIIVSEKAKAMGTPGDINFVDFGYYLVGDRQAMSARQSEEFRFQNDLTAFRVIERVDGQPWLKSAITPQNGGDTLTPFVGLAN
jgi:HK97 family phage major capsid protein